MERFVESGVIYFDTSLQFYQGKALLSLLISDYISWE